MLGLIALRGPSTAYELKRALSRITSEFLSVPHVTPIRDPGQLRLLFAELADPAAIAEHAGAQIRVYETRLATLDATEARLAGDAVRAPRLGPLQLGRAVYAAALSFWSSVAEAPDSPASSSPDAPVGASSSTH